ncbi:MAG: hypothetical protein AAF927_01405 [Bacteroidota bacterium]
MAPLNRLNFTIKTQTSTSLKLKWSLGAGLIGSLTLAALLLSVNDTRPSTSSPHKTAVVKINPLEVRQTSSKAEAGARKEISKIAHVQASLAFDKSSEAVARRQKAAAKLALLKALEDIQLKRKLHSDDPAFDQALWLEKQKSIEDKLAVDAL